MGSSLILTHEDEPEADTVRMISDGLSQYKADFAPRVDRAPRYFIARDSGNKVVGGVRRVMNRSWLSVEWLFVAQTARRKGAGSRLLRAAEDEARSGGCRGAYLDTYSFQAPAFYKKLGFVEFGRLPDFPPGFDRIWFMKRF